MSYLVNGLLQMLHVLPPLVGLLLTIRIRTTQRWRTWALVFFGLSLVTVLLGGALTGSLFVTSGVVRGSLATIQLFSGVLNLVSVTASCAGVVAVLVDRREEVPSTPDQRWATHPEQPYPPQR